MKSKLWDPELKRVLVTGGAGFIGSHLCRRLLREGHEVVCMDNLLTGARENIEDLMSVSEFTFVEHDVTKFISVSGQLDAILHLASPASPADFERLPIQILKVGALGTHNALGLAKAKSAKFLLASTSECYGDPQVNPQPESYWGNVNPIGIRGVYDEAKRFAEAMTMAYHRYHGVSTRIARIFNTYGPAMRLDDGRAIPNFFTQALRGEDLTIYGTGDQTRSFTYISDLVDGILRLLNTECHQPINLGNPNEISITEVALKIIAITRSESTVRYMGTAPEDDPKVRRPDISRARAVLGWTPEVDLEEGLERTYIYFEKEIGC